MNSAGYTAPAGCVPPEADAGAHSRAGHDKRSGRRPLAVNFDASASSDPAGRALTNYGLDYGDGTVAVQSTPSLPSHTYTTTGTHTVSLQVTNLGGTLGAPLKRLLIAGHTFTEDGIAGQRRVAVINQEAADLYFSGKPLGAGVIDDVGNRAEIIGVVKSQVFGTFEQHAEPAIYFSMWQGCPPPMTLILKYSKWNSGVAAELRQKIQNVPGGSSTPIGIDTFERHLARSGLARLRIATLIGGASAATGLLLSIRGLLSSQSDA